MPDNSSRMIRPALAVLASVLAASPALAVVQVARPADKFVDMADINTHVMFNGSPYDTHYADWVKPRLVELGVRHVREDEGGCTTAGKARATDLAASGIKIDLTTSADPGAALASVRDCTNALNATTSVVEAVEAANERDGSWWPNAPAWAPWQTHLHGLLVGTGSAAWASNFAAALRTFSPPLADAAAAPGTLNGTFPGSTKAARATAAGAYYEYVNGHFYPSGDYPEGPGGGGYGQTFGTSLNTLKTNLGGTAAAGVYLPAVVSEFGYKQCNPQPGHPTVTQRAAAKYIPRFLFGAWNKSVKYAYVYALLDDSECFGLVDAAGVPKQAFTALKGTLALFRDPGPTWTPGSLDYTLAGNTANVATALAQKRNGVFYLVLWLAVGSSTGGDGTIPAGDIEPTPVALTITLAKPASAVTIHEPTFGAADIHVAGTSITQAPLSVRDHVMVVEITPSSPVRAALSRTHRLP